jgi:hypothetical protein
VAADARGRGLAVDATRFRLRWLAIVVAVMALLTAGWPLLNAAVANRQPLPGGARLTIGSGASGSATVTVGPGWSVQPAQSNGTQEYRLRNAAVVVDIRHLSLVDRHQVPRLWGGMRQVLAVIDPGARLSKPVSFTAAHELPALTGRISSLPLVGTVTIVPAPARDFAIGMVVLAPRGTSRARLAAAHRIIISLMFSRAGK